MLLLAGLLLWGTALADSQSARSLISDGNAQYEKGKFSEAEINYRKSMERDHGAIPGQFNLGDALHKQGKFDDAIREYEGSALKSEEKELKASAYYNIGNSLVKEQKYDDAVNAYVESLKLRPEDQDTKYNLSYALKMLQQQKQQQQQQQQKNQDKNKDQKQNKQQPQQQDKQEQQQPQPKDKQQDRPKPQPTPQEKKMSKSDAERILEVLKNNERDIQKRLHVRQAVRPKGEKDW
jgi:tetratricopeptide (TPR) repeat protein